MLTSILGERLSWHIGSRVFESAVVGPFTIRYGLKEGPYLGRHAIQHFYYRVAPSVETAVCMRKAAQSST